MQAISRRWGGSKTDAGVASGGVFTSKGEMANCNSTRVNCGFEKLDIDFVLCLFFSRGVQCFIFPFRLLSRVCFYGRNTF